ncbi:hypothetical protein LDL76_08735 [Salegentibacter mishustinae]|uniref:hypothetical protein n=1 Tax=Salegentibacter mishustinae TaxID=270918 RepID=UPI001CE0469F|nr:hypothetical protein [Salegentibacter mishustinae]UBZ08782.1 hypothetical protein LDL76_08735 [Salegentibacter mishustinae]
MPKKKSLSNDTLIRLFAINLIKDNNSNRLLSLFRLNSDQHLYNRLIEQLSKFPQKLTKIPSGNTVRSLRDLDSTNLISIDLDGEMAWAKTVLAKNAKSLSRFLILSENFQSFFLGGKYYEAEKVLNEIESTFGQSIWLIKNKIAFLQITKGLEAQKEYVNKLKDQFNEGSLVKFIVHYCSVRNEENTVLSRFNKRIEKIAGTFEDKTYARFKEYTYYHLLNDKNLTPEEYKNVLCLEFSRSIIDFYEAYIRLLKKLVVDEDERLQRKAENFINHAYYQFDDSRVKVLNAYINNTFCDSILDTTAAKLYEELFKGNYFSVAEKSIKLLNREPKNSLYLGIVSHAISKMNDFEMNQFRDSYENDSLNYSIANDLGSVLRRGSSDAQGESTKLEKLVINLSNLHPSAIIAFLLKQESALFQDHEENEINKALEFPKIHPIFLDVTDKRKNTIRYKNICVKAYPDISSSNTFHYLGKENIEFSNDFANWICAINNFNNSKFQIAIKYADELNSSGLQYFVRRAKGILCYAQMNLNNLTKACKFSVDFYLNNSDVYNFLPFNELFPKVDIGSEPWNQLADSIDLSIFFDIYLKNSDYKEDIHLRFSYEDFLTKNGMSKPSDLRSRVDHYPKEKLIYYLKNICIQSNMDTSGAFPGGSQEVLSERLAVCRMLLVLDPKNEKSYQKEIEQLIRTQIIAKKRKEIDQSRIYTDIPKIRERIFSELKDSYRRYQDYLRAGLVSKDFEKTGVKNQKLVEKNFQVPKDESRALLKFMFEESLSAYLSQEFGLDRFLSTRIRHGILENQLRPPLDHYNLITKRVSKKGPYLDNNYWPTKLSTLNTQDEIEALNNLFKEFSKEYDSLINEINHEWLQIFSSSKPKGLFKFAIEDENVSVLSEMIDVDTTFEEFIDLTINVLEQTLIVTLINVREALIDQAKPRAKNIIINFQDKLSNYRNGLRNFTEIQDSLNRAKIDIQNQFDKVVEWFVPPSSGDSSPFLIEDAVSVAEAIIMEGENRFNIEIEATEESKLTIHGNLPIFVDVFVNLFDNVVKRSGLEQPFAIVTIDATEEKDDLTIFSIKVENRVNLREDEEIFKKKLDRKRELIKSGDYRKMIASDSNSGLFKVYKSINDLHVADYQRNAEMEFSYIEQSFIVKIQIPFRLLKLDIDNKNN